MKIAIIGDSFALHYTNTWFEKIVNGCNLELSTQVGFPGMSEYKIYKKFKDILNLKTLPDIILICHTEPSRLYHPKYSVRPQLSTGPEILLKDFRDAVQKYYDHLYDEEFAKEIYKFLLTDIQNICKDKKIKLINVPCFQHDFLDKKYGLWLTVDGGLVTLTSHTREDKEYDSSILRLNHFDATEHDIIAADIIPCINNFINGDKEFDSVSILTEGFN